MKLEVLRISSQEDSTSGLLFDVTGGERKFLCYTLEDEHRDTKVMHETRVPAGKYKLGLRTVGGFHAKYKKRYGDMHKGMIEVLDIPNFKYVLLHVGNTDENTSGCLLVGESQTSNLVQKNGFVGSSGNAYKRIYPAIAEALLNNQDNYITYVDYDGLRLGVDDLEANTEISSEKLRKITKNLIEITDRLQRDNDKLAGKHIE